MKNIAVLGSTGSIGRQTLEVVAAHPEEFKIIALGCNVNIDLLEKQIKQFKPLFVAVTDEKKGRVLAQKLSQEKIKIFYGSGAMEEAAIQEKIEMVVISMVGSAGISPTIKAIRAKKDIALATKEVMVCAGDLINEEVKKNKVKLLPVDSEHSAIFQCINGRKKEEIGKLYLTCSGGAFRGKIRSELEGVKSGDALKHPNWSMGAKITIDCATLMNKGLEVIEAQKLFGIEVENIEVIIHPQSIIHSMVEFVDGSVIAQLGPKDMRFPIRYALSYPRRLNNHFEFLNPFSLEGLTFGKPDLETFECLGLALMAGKIGGSMPVVLNAADEVAVSLFLEGKIKFLEIPLLVKLVMSQYKSVKKPSLEEILEIDLWARQKTRENYMILYGSEKRHLYSSSF